MSKPRPLRGVRDLRDDAWMIREGLAEVEQDQAKRFPKTPKRYELSGIPYLGTDGAATALDLVPHPRNIYQDNSDYVKLCKRGGHKNIVWWHPDFPIDAVEEQPRRLLRPRPAEWSVHPASLLPNPREDFAKTRKLPPTCNPRIPNEKLRLDASKMPVATGAPCEYSWESTLKRERPSMHKIMTNGYLLPYLIEVKKKQYYDSLFDRPHNEQEKLAVQMFNVQRKHNLILRETAARFDRLSRGKASWTDQKKLATRQYLFPNGYGHGVRAPPPPRPRVLL